MAQYVLVYLGGNPPSTPEEGQKHFARYMEWIKSLGDAAVSPANPLKDTHTVLPDGSIKDGGMIGMSGYTVVEADSMDGTKNGKIVPVFRNKWNTRSIGTNRYGDVKN